MSGSGQQGDHDDDVAERRDGGHLGEQYVAEPGSGDPRG
jgi:hypothetical protein